MNDVKTIEGPVSKLIERLRTLQDHYSVSGRLGPENRRIFAEAANEIERLTALAEPSRMTAEPLSADTIIGLTEDGGTMLKLWRINCHGGPYSEADAIKAACNWMAENGRHPGNGQVQYGIFAWREIEIVRLIDLLRSQEGDDVTILCDNPDFNGQPNCAVVCNGDWTEYKDHRFVGDTVLDALSAAATDYNLKKPRDVIAESDSVEGGEK